MKVALFIPCYVDQLYPEVAKATLKLLENLGLEVEYPLDQTCCGQPMANAGFSSINSSCDKNFIKNFKGYDYIVSPSGSCVLHVKEHLSGGASRTEADAIRKNVYELTEFLIDIVKVERLSAYFPHKVGFHISCHGQRGLHLSSMSEIVGGEFSKPLQLLNMVEGLELIPLSRKDECCGFGGTFAIFEEAVSVKMGKDRINDHKEHGAEFITGGDMSCLMHLEGILKKENNKIKAIHIAEILAAGQN